jgi:hypothetical protein
MLIQRKEKYIATSPRPNVLGSIRENPSSNEDQRQLSL